MGFSIDFRINLFQDLHGNLYLLNLHVRQKNFAFMEMKLDKQFWTIFWLQLRKRMRQLGKLSRKDCTSRLLQNTLNEQCIFWWNTLSENISVYLFFSDYKILEGKAAMYKRGYHILLRRLKKVTAEKKSLKKEVRRLQNALQLHEDLAFLFWLFLC